MKEGTLKNKTNVQLSYEHQGIHILVILSPARTFIQAASVPDHAIIFSASSSCNVLESWHKNRK